MGVEGRLGLETVRTHSAEAQLVLAFVGAHCAGLSPKRRVAFLKAVGEIFEAWEALPISVNDHGLRQARLDAAELFKANVTALLG